MNAPGAALPLRVAVPLFPYDRWPSVDAMVDAIRHADVLGYDAVAFPEHLVMPATDGVSPISAVWYDNFVLAAALAAATTNIRLLFDVCVVPYRHPVELAKLVSTLDVVSRGRVVLTAGTGWMRREFRILGVPYEERGPRTDDALRAMKVLWTEEVPSYEGPYFSIPPVHFLPKCVQRPHVPLWIGGNGSRPARRAVELGDGWLPLNATEEEAATSIARLSLMLEAAGRDASSFTFGLPFSYGPPDPQTAAAFEHVAQGRTLPGGQNASETVDAIGRLRSLGVNLLALQFGWESVDDYKETLESFASEILVQL